MPVTITEKNEGRVLELVISGKLHSSDYDQFVPHTEELIKRHGKIRILAELADFHGWDVGALWDDIKFDIKHFNDIERLALVGDTKWEKGMSVFCKPFTTAEVRFFSETETGKSAAEAWILEGLGAGDRD